MDRSRIIVFAAAAVVALIVAVILTTVTGNGEKVVQVAAPDIIKMPETSVLVAVRDLRTGHQIRPGDLTWQAWPNQGLSAAYIQRNSQPDAVNNFVGRHVRTHLLAKEPISRAKIVDSQGGYMAASITAGMRAMSIPISASSAAGGFVLPNDHVDVILTQSVTLPFQREVPDEVVTADQSFRSRTILEDVRVLALDQQVEEVSGTTSVVARIATLELNPRDVELLTRSMEAGRLSLVLRATADINGDLGAASRAVGLVHQEDEESSTKKRQEIEIVKYGKPATSVVIQN